VSCQVLDLTAQFGLEPFNWKLRIVSLNETLWLLGNCYYFRVLLVAVCTSAGYILTRLIIA